MYVSIKLECLNLETSPTSNTLITAKFLKLDIGSFVSVKTYKSRKTMQSQAGSIALAISKKEIPMGKSL